jgi:hypothetical protein
MNRTWMAAVVLLGIALFFGPGCGATLGSGRIVVHGLAPDQTLLCENESVLISGSGFLSEHGNVLTIIYTATSGTPFDGSATEEVMGIALSDTLIDVPLPSVTGPTELTVTVILPGDNSGVSEPEVFNVGGTVFGPFANVDFRPDVIGNVTYAEAAPGVLANDSDSICASGEGEQTPEKPSAGASTFNHNLAVIPPPLFSGNPFDATPGVLSATQQGGTVLIQADGSYVYEPPLGFEGPDSFTYWIEEPGRPDPSDTIVLLQVSHMVWFIDGAASPGGTGRMSDPFDSLDAFNTVQNVPPSPPSGIPPAPISTINPDDQPQEGDCIFVYDRAGTVEYDGGIRLRDGQELIGNGVDLVLNGMTVVPASTLPTPNPVLTNSAPAFGETPGGYPVVTLGNGNVIRGIDIDEPSGSTVPIGNGIFGFAVSGNFTDPDPNPRDKTATLIDAVGISNTGPFSSGIRLVGGSGLFQVGDATQPAAPARVRIRNSGLHGIEIAAFSIVNTSAVTGGLSLEVYGADIANCAASGIFANDVNLDVDQCVIDSTMDGVTYANFAFGQTCTLRVVDSLLGVNVPIGFRGITCEPFGPIDATISNNEIHGANEAIYAGIFSTGSALELVMDGNTCESTVTGTAPTIYAFGISTTVTSMSDNTVIGNGAGGGIQCSSVTFDADTGAAGIQQVAGGVTRLGQSTAARVEDTALRFFGCAGDLAFTSVDVFQVAGLPAGFVNSGGTLVLNLGTFTIDFVP